MSENPIVTFRGIKQTLKSQEAAPPELEKMTAEIADSPAEAAMFMASLNKALQVLEESEHEPGVMTAPDHKFASLLQSHFARNATDFETLKTGGREAKYDNHDVSGWLKSLFSWFKGLKKEPWLSAPDEAETFANRTRLGLLGDWGTGLYGAPVCAQSLNDDADGYNLLFHLGDVYYSGTELEVAESFLKFWPQNDTTLKGSVSRACNSNHEMYTGGEGYFKVTLEAFKQKASDFAMQNDHWLLLGLDTAYFTKDVMHNKADLSDEQIAWINRRVDEADGRRVILFSHHQPFSFYDGQNTLMTDRLAHLLNNKKIFAWYWGHEHRCIIYDRHPLWGLHGRCAGHSGFPYFRDKTANLTTAETVKSDANWYKLPQTPETPAALMIDGPNPYVIGKENKYGIQGYMSLEFDDAALNEIVHAPDGTILYNRRLI